MGKKSSHLLRVKGKGALKASNLSRLAQVPTINALPTITTLRGRRFII